MKLPLIINPRFGQRLKYSNHPTPSTRISHLVMGVQVALAVASNFSLTRRPEVDHLPELPKPIF